MSVRKSNSTLALLFIFLILSNAGCIKKKTIIQEIRISDCRILEISIASHPLSDEIVTVCYEIFDNGHSIMKDSFGFCDADIRYVAKLKFFLWQTDDKLIFAIAEQSQPTTLRIVYEENSGLNWPFCVYESGWQECYSKTMNLVKILEKENPGKVFDLKGRAGGFLPELQ